MKVNEILKLFKSQKHLADILGVNDSTVAQWKRRDAIPANRIQQILCVAQTEHVAIAPSDFFQNGNYGNDE